MRAIASVTYQQLHRDIARRHHVFENIQMVLVGTVVTHFQLVDD
jgi:hypothetical protein